MPVEIILLMYVMPNAKKLLSGAVLKERGVWSLYHT